jgi:hypothetical protein
LAALAVFILATVAHAAGVVSFSPTPTAVAPNDTVEVDVWVDADVDSIHCFRVLVDSVEDGITLLDVRRGSLIPSGNTFFFWKDTLGGYDIFACFLGPGTFANGPGSLAKMTFASSGSPCGNPLSYRYVLIQDAELDSQAVAYANGEFSSPGCCACPCLGDPACDGASDILDVVQTVGAAFRNATPVTDQNCPTKRTDVDCSGDTDILDVVLVVSVAFRNGNPATLFCQPCR